MGLSGTDYEAYLEAAAIKMESLFPVVLTFGGEDYAATGGGVLSTEDAEPGGFEENGRQLVRVRKSLMATPPDVGDKVSVDGAERRVTLVSAREWDIAWHLELELLR